MEEVLKIVELGLNPLISWCENPKILSKHSSYGVIPHYAQYVRKLQYKRYTQIACDLIPRLVP